MNKNQTSKWFVDFFLTAVFLLDFFPDLTGLALHQWAGVAAFGLAAYHLITHWNWVRSVTMRYFAKTSVRARLYYLLDAVIFAGFLIIGLTGLAISTWLNLSLGSYALWRNVHIQASILTLVLTGIKIAMHWRWVTATTRKIFSWAGQQPSRESPVLRSVPAAVPIQSGQPMTRRDFIKVIGIVGVASFLALRSAASGLSDAIASQANADTASSESTRVNAVSNSQSLSGDSNDSSTSSQTCSVLCERRCSYPGQCRRYVDSNGNGRCDNGECI